MIPPIILCFYLDPLSFSDIRSLTLFCLTLSTAFLTPLVYLCHLSVQCGVATCSINQPWTQHWSIPYISKLYKSFWERGTTAHTGHIICRQTLLVPVSCFYNWKPSHNGLLFEKWLKLNERKCPETLKQLTFFTICVVAHKNSQHRPKTDFYWSETSNSVKNSEKYNLSVTVAFSLSWSFT